MTTPATSARISEFFHSEKFFLQYKIKNNSTKWTKRKRKKKKKKVIFYLFFLEISPLQGFSVNMFLTYSKNSYLFSILSNLYGSMNQNFGCIKWKVFCRNRYPLKNCCIVTFLQLWSIHLNNTFRRVQFYETCRYNLQIIG